jgi:hypothetical protein
MPNGVTYSDESTTNKVYTALHGDNDLSFPQVLAAVDRLNKAGIIFREPAESVARGPRTKAETDAETAADSKRVEDINSRVDQVTQGSAQTSVVD